MTHPTKKTSWWFLMCWKYKTDLVLRRQLFLKISLLPNWPAADNQFLACITCPGQLLMWIKTKQTNSNSSLFSFSDLKLSNMVVHLQGWLYGNTHISTSNFYSSHSMRGVNNLPNTSPIHCVPKWWPTWSWFKLGIRLKKDLVADGTFINSFLLVINKTTSKGSDMQRRTFGFDINFPWSAFKKIIVQECKWLQ